MSQYKKKLIEVALPLEAINRESAREKSIRHGHPSTLHLWWARRPLAACRAVLFASLVDDPSSLPEEFPTEESQEKERQRLFRIIEELVKWDNSNNEEVLDRARKEILRSTDGNPPPVLDPFCGGGSIPLEAQRLGLEAHGSDLNPVAVLITKALIEIPPKFANRPPVNPDAKKKLTHSARWKGAQGLADDVRYYGKWMRDEAEKRIGHLYPSVTLEDGRAARVIAWLWARTVACSNPACGIKLPLLRSFTLSTKAGKEVSMSPRIEARAVRFDIQKGKTDTSGGTISRTGAKCVSCGSDVDLDYIRDQGRTTGLPAQMTAVVVEDGRVRSYVQADEAQVTCATVEPPSAAPDTSMPEKALGFRTQAYGILKHRDLFTPRQLVALTTLSDLVPEARARVLAHSTANTGDNLGLADGGCGATAYADAVATYLGLGVSKLADYNCANVTWSSSRDQAGHAFTRQAIPMVWDFAEVNPFAEAAGDLFVTIRGIAECLENLPAHPVAFVSQLDAQSAGLPKGGLVATDPPYYDNISYADLSDFFYVWLRRSLLSVFDSLFSTLLTPKTQELVATPYRFNGDADAANNFFEQGFKTVFAKYCDTRYPLPIFYAFKQSEEDEGESSSVISTGWETMLEGIIEAGLAIVGTWPMRTERASRTRGIGSNALATSVVLVCRAIPRAAIGTRREFIAALKSELPDALKKLQHSSIAAVDLAQAAIGPGMAVFSRYARVIESDGSPMRVRSALQLINQALDEVLAEQETEYDADTQWAVAWFDSFGTSEAPFGEAETLSKAKNTSVGGLVESGLLRAAKGKVQLLGREQLDAGWDPTTDRRLTIWEVTQHLIRRLKTGGEQAAADLLRKVGGMGEMARDLAYRLYSVCERKGWTEEAIAYNSLVVAWPEIRKLASERGSVAGGESQMTLG